MSLPVQRRIALHATLMVAYLSRTTTAFLPISQAPSQALADHSERNLHLTEKLTQKQRRSKAQHHMLSTLVAEAELPVALSAERHHASASSMFHAFPPVLIEHRDIGLLCMVAVGLIWAVRVFQTWGNNAEKATPTKGSERRQEVCSEAPSKVQECLSNLEAQGIVEGTTLICTADTDIFESTDSWDTIDTVAAYSRLTADAPPVKREGFMMIPIKPEGAVEASVVRVEIDGIVEGTTLVCTEDADIFEAADSWDAIATVLAGARLVAAAPPVTHEGFTMIPIKPKGFVESSSFHMEAISFCGP